MSQWRGQIENIEEPEDVLEFVGDYYHVPALLALLGFMLWNRVRDWDNFVVDGTVMFSGNDAWYHYRTVSYSVQNWPETLPFDPWTYFPYGTNSSQFGTLFDQLVATVALVVGLGNPSDQTVRMVLLFAPAIFGTAVAIPTYFIGKRAGGRLGGVVAVGVLALVGSVFVSRGTVGFSDHHIAEVFFQTLAVLTTMIAVSVANAEKPVWELFEARDVDALRRPLGWAALSGVAIALYIWTWAPGTFLLGILGVFYLLELSSQYAHGESPEHVAIVGAISMSVTGVLTLASIETINLSGTSYNLVQPGLAFAVAFGCAFMAWFARTWDDRDLPRYQYPAAIVGIIAVLAALAALLLPQVFDFFVSQLTRVVGFTISERAATIGEAQSLSPSQLFVRYRFTIFIAGLGALYVFVRHFYRKPRSEWTLLAVWGAFILAATLTQRRFDYYLAVPVAVFAGLVIGRFTSYADLFDSSRDIEAYQVLTVVAVILVVFAPLVYPTPLAMELSNAGPGQGVQSWNQSLGWMEDSTPEEGKLAGAEGEMEYYGTYRQTDDYDYEEGAYGVLSWWDYGHWITVNGERIPTANPFQQGPNEAANFLLSTNESQANDVLGRLKDGNGTETRYVMVDWKMVNSHTQYRTGSGSISLNGKYFAPFQFYDDGNISRSSYYSPLFYDVQFEQGQFQTFNRHQQNYYNSTAVRLYHYHGSAMEPQPYVLDWEMESYQGGQYPVSQGVQGFDSMEAAREFVANDSVARTASGEVEPTSQIGGFGPYPEERVPALENYRLVQMSESSASSDSDRYLWGLSKTSRGALQQPLLGGSGTNPQIMNFLHQTDPAWVKVFEKVDGGTIEGEGPENATVTAAVDMQTPDGRNFTYRQQAQTGPDGEFSMTVPYATEGYEEWGTDEGYTDVNVRAEGPYRIQTSAIPDENFTVYRYNGTVDVSEGQVLGEVDEPSEVTLEREVLSEQQDDGNESDGESGNETTPDDSGNETGGDGDDGTTETSSDEETASGEQTTSDGETATPPATDSDQ